MLCSRWHESCECLCAEGAAAHSAGQGKIEMYFLIICRKGGKCLENWIFISNFAACKKYIVLMNTLTIDQKIYNGAEMYAKKHNVSVKQLVEDYLVSIIMMDKSAPVNKDYSYEEIIDETMLLDCFDYAHKEYLDGKCKSHSQVISEIKQEKGWK